MLRRCDSTEEQLGGDLLVGLAVGDEERDLTLAAREGVDAAGGGGRWPARLGARAQLP